MVSWLRWSRNQRAASTPMSSSRSSSVTISPRALGHLHPLAALGEVDELHDHELEPLGLAAERLPDRLHALDVAVVVGAPDVDRAVVAACELVQVVGDVGGEVGVARRRAPQHAVLVVAEGRRCAARARPRARRLPVSSRSSAASTCAGLVERALGEEAVHAHPEALEGRAHSVEHQLDAAPGQLVGVGLRRALDPLRPARSTYSPS